MANHTFQPTEYHTTMGSHEPVLIIAAGDRIITTTVDASGRDATGAQITPGGNPMTGPFFGQHDPDFTADRAIASLTT